MSISSTLLNNVDFVDHLTNDELIEILVFRAHAIQFTIMRDNPSTVDIEMDDDDFLEQTVSSLCNQGFEFGSEFYNAVIVPIYDKHFKKDVNEWLRKQKVNQYIMSTIDLFDEE